jgi:NAD(P)-dependent dehydrogenase (short-subunit alcohol dehydrogenase family)
MAVDLGRDGIRVNTLCPGWVDTHMADKAASAAAQIHHVDDAEARDLLVRNNPIRRMADPDEIARCVEFLASDASSFVTGTVLVADGGQSIVDLGTLALGRPAETRPITVRHESEEP